MMLHWDQSPPRPTWAELAHVPAHPHSARFVADLERTAWDWILPGKVWGALVVTLCALAAFVIGIRSMPWEALRAARRERRLSRRRRSGMRFAAVAVAVYVLATANVLSVAGYPYGSAVYDLSVKVTGSLSSAWQGQEVDFQLIVKDTSNYQGYGPVGLRRSVSPRGCTSSALPTTSTGQAAVAERLSGAISVASATVRALRSGSASGSPHQPVRRCSPRPCMPRPLFTQSTPPRSRSRCADRVAQAVQ